MSSCRLARAPPPPIAGTIAALLALLLALLLVAAPSSAASVSSRKPRVEHHHGGSGSQNCTNHLQIIDRCASLAAYSFTTELGKFANNSNELKTSCERVAGGLKCLKSYSKCMSSLSRRAISSFTTSRSRHSKQLCMNTEAPKAREFVNLYQCITANGKVNQMFASEKELIGSIELLTKNTSMKWSDRFHQSCCTAAHFKQQTVSDIEPECSKYKQAQEDLVESMMGELLDSACPEDNRLNEICKKLPKLKLTKDWKPVSLTSAGLELIVALADDPDKE